MRIIILNPGVIVGPGSQDVNRIARALRYLPLIPMMSYINSFVDVRDVAEGLIAAAKHGKRGESYILSGHKISVRYLLETVREITGRHFFQMKIPFDLAKFVALFTPMYYSAARVNPRFTPYSLEVLRSNANISHAKATRELGYTPRSLYESIKDTVKWFLEKK